VAVNLEVEDGDTIACIRGDPLVGGAGESIRVLAESL
jgi:hypothetical protein